jgi:hypothetical protein
MHRLDHPKNEPRKDSAVEEPLKRSVAVIVAVEEGWGAAAEEERVVVAVVVPTMTRVDDRHLQKSEHYCSVDSEAMEMQGEAEKRHLVVLEVD